MRTEFSASMLVSYPLLLPSLEYTTLQQLSPEQHLVQPPHSDFVLTSGDMNIIAPASESTLAPGLSCIVRTWQSEPEKGLLDWVNGEVERFDTSDGVRCIDCDIGHNNVKASHC